MSLGEEQISFSCSVICISAESTAAHVRSPGPMASLPLVTPTSVWGRALWHNLTCVQPSTWSHHYTCGQRCKFFCFSKCWEWLPPTSHLLSSKQNSSLHYALCEILHAQSCLAFLFFFFNSGFMKDLCNQLLH